MCSATPTCSSAVESQNAPNSESLKSVNNPTTHTPTRNPQSEGAEEGLDGKAAGSHCVRRSSSPPDAQYARPSVLRVSWSGDGTWR
jgi:hypothetical protein